MFIIDMSNHKPSLLYIRKYKRWNFQKWELNIFLPDDHKQLLGRICQTWKINTAKYYITWRLCDTPSIRTRNKRVVYMDSQNNSNSSDNDNSNNKPQGIAQLVSSIRVGIPQSSLVCVPSRPWWFYPVVNFRVSWE